MAVAGEETRAIQRRAIPGQLATDSRDPNHEGAIVRSREHPYCHEGLQHLHRHEAGARKPGKRQCAIALGVFEQPVDPLEGIGAGRKQLFASRMQDFELGRIFAPQTILGMDDAVGEPAQAVSNRRTLFIGETRLSQAFEFVPVSPACSKRR